MTLTEWKQQMADLLAALPDDDGLQLERNAMGNLSLIAGDGEWVGYIDVLHPSDGQLAPR